MPTEDGTAPVVDRLTRKAPSRIPGQTRYPRTRNAARAMPAGGHTAVALALTNASVNPGLPARKYTAAITAHVRVSPLRSRAFTIGVPAGGQAMRASLRTAVGQPLASAPAA